MVGKDIPFYLKFSAKLTQSPSCENGKFQSIFARNASAVTAVVYNGIDNGCSVVN